MLSWPEQISLQVPKILVVVAIFTYTCSYSLERLNLKIIQHSTGSARNPYLLTDQEERSTIKRHRDNRQRLRVPRRPPWTKDMNTSQLEAQEKRAFLDWRRGLAEYARRLPDHEDQS
jgi:hypothetical protein